MGTSKKDRKLRVVRFAKEVLSGKSYKDAAIAVGYSPNGADVAGSRMANSPEVRPLLEAALDKAGATLEATAEVVAEGLRADKIISIGFKTHVVRDHATRLKAAELNGKFRKLLNPENAPTNVQINIIDLIAQQAQQRGLINGELKTP